MEVRKPNTRRHFGGPLPGGEFIARDGEFQSGRNVYTHDHLADMALQLDQLSQAVADMSGFDSLQIDANQFMNDLAQDIRIDGEINHQGNITLDLNQDANDLLQQLIELLQSQSGGVAVRQGDPIPSSLIRQ